MFGLSLTLHLTFLDFAPSHANLAEQMADAVTQHATPVGSGTVARTQRIPIERRAESAVIAWLRHQTTAYDNMSIARVKGKRREVRRMLAEQSRRLLEKYRHGHVALAVRTQLVLNVAWSWIFFGLHQPGWAFVEIIVLWLAIFATTVAPLGIVTRRMCGFAGSNQLGVALRAGLLRAPHSLGLPIRRRQTATHPAHP